MKVLFFISTLAIILQSCKEDERYMVVRKVKSTCAIATTETIIDKVVVGYKSKRTFFGLVGLGEATYMAETEATIKTGIRLEKIEPKDIKIDYKRIELKLPPVEVLNFDYPFEKVKVNEVATRNKLFNKITIHSEENFLRMAESDIRNNLEYTGIVEQTQSSIRKMLTSLLTQLGYQEVYIEFENDQLIQQIIIPELNEKNDE